jgi:hypothetical protein
MRGGVHIGVIVTFFFIALTIVIIVVAVRYQRRQRQKREEALTVVAQRLGGTLEPGSFWQQPKITFEYKGHAASIEYYSTGGKHPTLYTRLFFHFQRMPALEVRVYPERLFSKIGKFLGGQDIQLGDVNFDDKFMIKGSDDARVKDFLNPDVRQAVFELRAMTMNDHIEISTESTAFRIQKLSWLHAPDLLMSLVTLGQQVFDGYLTAATDGPVLPTEAKTEIYCSVCNDVVSGSMHTCPKCGAPHHPECYQLNDGCGRCS